MSSAKNGSFQSASCWPGLVSGSWQYNRTQEKISKLQLALSEHKLVKENRERPERSIFHVRVSGMELGTWEGNLRASDIRITRPGTIVLVELAHRPLTGTYLKSVASLPAPQYTYVPPSKGREFEWAFLLPPPPGTVLQQVHSTSDPSNQTAQVALAFRTDRATFDRIRSPGLERIPFNAFSVRYDLDRQVLWWTKTTEATEIWGRNARDGSRYHKNKEDHFAHELTVLTWDESGLVQYLWWGRGLRNSR